MTASGQPQNMGMKWFVTSRRAHSAFRFKTTCAAIELVREDSRRSVQHYFEVGNSSLESSLVWPTKDDHLVVESLRQCRWVPCAVLSAVETSDMRKDVAGGGMHLSDRIFFLSFFCHFSGFFCARLYIKLCDRPPPFSVRSEFVAGAAGATGGMN